MNRPRIDEEKWRAFSRGTQLQHIAAELERGAAALARRDMELSRAAYERALELVDASLADPRWAPESLRLRKLRDALAALYVQEEVAAATSRALSEELMAAAAAL